jgi:hypothetical protein
MISDNKEMKSETAHFLVPTTQYYDVFAQSKNFGGRGTAVAR